MDEDRDDLIATGSGNRLWGDRQVRWARPLVLFFSSYSIFSIIGFFEQEPEGARRAVGLAVVAAFVVLYVRIVWYGLVLPCSNRTPRTLAAMTVLALPLALLLGRDGMDLALFWLLACYVLSLRRRWWFPTLGIALGIEATVLVLVIELPLPLIGASLLRTIGYAVLLMGFYQLVRLLIELGDARAALARYAVTEERLRLARDLHDLLGQRLSGAGLRAELASRLAFDDPGRASDEALAAAELSRDALAEVRTAVSGYRRMTTGGELETAAPLLSASGVELRTTVRDEPLPHTVDELGAWVIREGVTNIVRHARAHTCWISIADGDPVVVQVTDDGRGAQQGWGNGLTGLADRLRGSGSRLTTFQERGRFHLRAEIPGTAS